LWYGRFVLVVVLELVVELGGADTHPRSQPTAAVKC
jgi:hypothetical protein